MSAKAKLHVKPSKKDLIYTCQYKVVNTDGTERTCGDEVSYGSFRNHVIIQHLNSDTSKWNPEQYTTMAASSPTKLTPRAIAERAEATTRVDKASSSDTASSTTQHDESTLQQILSELKRLNERVDATWQLTRAIAVKVSVDSAAAAAAVLSTATAEATPETSSQSTEAQPPTASEAQPPAAPAVATSLEASAEQESTVPTGNVDTSAAPIEALEPPKKKRDLRRRGRK